MPVWHADTEAWRTAGDLVVVGITQEQHPARCELFAQWHGIDWPILWDPFNVTGSEAVPFACFVDEHGVVRSVVRDASELGALLAAEYEAPEAREREPMFSFESAAGMADAHHAALCALLRGPDAEARDGAIDTLERLAAARPDDGALRFHAGVARRMRADSGAARQGDFQAALDHWSASLGVDPNQYIRRRRIQQYGPRLDKPYPFYGWVAEARAAIRARGEEPVELVATLTGSELASGARSFAEDEDAVCPDPKGAIARDTTGLVAFESAVAWDTSEDGSAAVVHLRFAPDAGRDVHWTNDAGPLEVWIGDPELLEGARVSKRLLRDAGPPREVSSEVRALDVEVLLASGHEGPLRGFALYYVCEGASGECVYRRLDFEVRLER